MSKDPETPVKTWQLDALEKQQGIQDRFTQRMDEKLENILGIVQKLPTTTDLETRITAVKLEFQTQIKAAVDVQDLKYQPIIATNKWMLRLLIGSTVTLMGSVFLLLIQVFNK